jgi:hypothetical protein
MYAGISRANDSAPSDSVFSMRGRVLVGAVAAALGIAGCAGSASNPLCADSGCAEVSGVVQKCDDAQPRHCHPERVATVELLDDHGHIVQQADGAAGHKLDGEFVFKGVTPGDYILKTQALGRTWTRQVQAPVNATIHSDITVRP